MVLVHDLVQQREPSSAEINKPVLCWPSHVQVPYFSRSLLIRAQRNGTHIPEQLSRLQLSRRMKVALDLVHCRKRAQTAHESGTPCCDFALHLTHPHRPTRCTGDPVLYLSHEPGGLRFEPRARSLVNAPSHHTILRSFTTA